MWRALVRVLVGVPVRIRMSVTHRLGGLVSASKGGGNSPARALSCVRRWVIEAIAPPVGYTIRGHLHFGAPAITVGAAQAVSSVSPVLVCRSSEWLQRAQYMMRLYFFFSVITRPFPRGTEMLRCLVRESATLQTVRDPHKAALVIVKHAPPLQETSNASLYP